MAHPADSSVMYSDPTFQEMRSSSMYPFFKAEYKEVPDQLYAFHNYKSAQQPKTTLLDRVKNMFTIFRFDMNFTQKSIEDYLSRSRDHYDLEQRERNVMNGNVRFA
tara:strand:+ start:70 stop:387 length:318 start_codon:yes stop_codon:yes gene_type:complete